MAVVEASDGGQVEVKLLSVSPDLFAGSTMLYVYV